jgi:uncharacterized protein YlzI (FlbEa/FlbD family)
MFPNEWMTIEPTGRVCIILLNGKEAEVEEKMNRVIPRLV